MHRSWTGGCSYIERLRDPGGHSRRGPANFLKGFCYRRRWSELLNMLKDYYGCCQHATATGAGGPLPLACQLACRGTRNKCHSSMDKARAWLAIGRTGNMTSG